jgi:kynureninase
MTESPRLAGDALDRALAALPTGPLTEEGLRRAVAPLFARHRAALAGRIYLANHSLGRPLDATEDDVRAGLAAWYEGMGSAWEAWMAEIAAFRARLAELLNAPRPDCVVPKASAGQGLRAVLNALPGVPRVVATRGEFDSLDVVLRDHAQRGRIELRLVEARADGNFDAADLAAAIGPGVDLVVVSQVMFQTGQRIVDIAAIAAHARASGARVLLDVYHSLGVLPVDVVALDVDFAVGGSYKYLRGGTGACFLYLAPRVLDAGLRTPDTGWFAKEAPFEYARPDPPRYGPGGDAWLESTPAILPFYQARAGQRLTLGIGVPRLRAHSLRLQQRLVTLLGERGVAARGGTVDRGAFVVIRHPQARRLAAALGERGVVTDARDEWWRLCPDLLTSDAELAAAAAEVVALIAR